MNIFDKSIPLNPMMDVLPPDIHPVVILQGSDYEMGFQYGKFAGQMVERRKDKVLAVLQQKMNPEEITKEKIIDAIEKTTDYDIGGIKLNFDPKTRQISNFVWVDDIEKNKIEKFEINK